MTVEATMLIGGKPVTTADWVAVANPACKTETVGRYPDCTPDAVDRAVAAAAHAFPEWSLMPANERAARLLAAANTHMSRMKEWVPLLTRENGKVLSESGVDLAVAGVALQAYAAKADLLADRVIQDDTGKLVIRHAPIGVCAGIVPWNFPVALSAVKVAPALLAGNTMVLKAPDESPLTMMLAMSAIAEQLPPGVLNIVSGRSPVIGQRLVGHPQMRKVAFTGGSATGKAVMAGAAEHLAQVTLELGGNDAAILLDDVNLDDDVARHIVNGAFASTGQICFAIKRLFVHRSRYDEVVELLQSAVGELVVGDGTSPEVTMGPLNNARHFESVRGLVHRTERSGHSVVELGRYTDGTDVDAGYFLRPRLVLDPPDSSEIVACEQFGPILPILAFDDEDDAVRRANDSEFGLCSSVWSSDVERAFRVAERVEAGTTFINGHSLLTVDLDAPFGGVKQSGFGRELGNEGLFEYVQLHSITSRRAS